MDNLNLTTLERGRTSIDSAAIDALAAGFRGSLVSNSDANYEETRAIWNAMVERKPGRLRRFQL